MRPKAEATSATAFFTAASSPVSALMFDYLDVGLAADVLRGSGERRLVARDDGDVDAFLRQLSRDRLADAAVAAGDDRRLAFEIQVHGCASS